MLTVENIGMKYLNSWIFRHISFQLNKGDICIIAGKNGIGKSTLLKIFAQLESPTEGKVILESPSMKSGYLSPEMHLYPELSLNENIHLIRTIHPDNTHVDTELLIKKLGLSTYQNTPYSMLSTGMKYRIKLISALMLSNGILILDEPTISLDKDGVEMVQEIIEDFRKIGIVILATNNDLEYQWGNKIVNLDERTLCATV